LQPAFQSSATPLRGGRAYLAWNMVGTITTRMEPTLSYIEILFNESEENKKVRFIDHYNFDMASLGMHGAIFACPSASGEEGCASTIFYKPFSTWAANADWTYHLDKGEEAAAVCVGAKFAAVATSKQLLRVFSYSGYQKVMSVTPSNCAYLLPVPCLDSFSSKHTRKNFYSPIIYVLYRLSLPIASPCRVPSWRCRRRVRTCASFTMPVGSASVDVHLPIHFFYFRSAQRAPLMNHFPSVCNSVSAGAPLPGGSQKLHYQLYDVDKAMQLSSGPVPLSPGGT
jgi:hypothetical protein